MQELVIEIWENNTYMEELLLFCEMKSDTICFIIL